MLKRILPADRWIAAALLSLAFATGCSAQTGPLQDLATFPRASLEITPAVKKQNLHKHHFNVWIADTPSRQEQGLMFVRDLPASEGMIFPQERPQIAHFWMKNTYVELDLIFIATDGHIVKIIERAHPMSLDTLSSDQPVGAVLEIKGGEAARRELRVGDRAAWTAASQQRPLP